MNEEKEGKSWIDKGPLVGYESRVMDDMYLALRNCTERDLVYGLCWKWSSRQTRNALKSVLGLLWFMNFDGIMATRYQQQNLYNYVNKDERVKYCPVIWDKNYYWFNL